MKLQQCCETIVEKQSHINELSMTVEKYKHESTEKQHQFDELSKSLDRSEEICQSRINENVRLLAERDDLAVQLENIQSSCSSITSANNEEIHSLRLALSSADENYIEMEKSLQENFSKIESLQSTIVSREQEVEKSQKSSAEFEADSAAKQVKICSLESSVAELEGKVSELLKARESFDLCLLEKQLCVEELEKSITKHERNIAELNEDKSKKGAKIKELEEKLDYLNSSLSEDMLGLLSSDSPIKGL
jgi:chromosome segregation ATPase